MSAWQMYIDEQMVGTGMLSKAAIIGSSDGSTLAESDDGLLKPGEGAAIVALFKTPTDAFARGVTVGGVKYMGLKADNRSIQAKRGAMGVALARTTQAILIGMYDETGQPGNAATAVEKLADYLMENGQ